MKIDKLFIFTFLFVLMSVSHAQNNTEVPRTKLPSFGLKTNLLYAATSTLNIGGEFRINDKRTWTLPIGYNPWTFSENKKLKHWIIQPELRFWSCEAFNGFYWGVHAHGGEFNVGGLKLPFGMFPTLQDHRYQGYFYGGGLGLGYQWILHDRWNLELGIGAGYTRFEYDKYRCEHCGEKIKTGSRNYFGPDRIALSLIYIIR